MMRGLPVRPSQGQEIIGVSKNRAAAETAESNRVVPVSPISAPDGTAQSLLDAGR
jgi:hypothetical protein